MAKQTIGIIDIGLAGNIFNIHKAISNVGANTCLVANEEDLNSSDKLILPGVGSYSIAMEHFEKTFGIPVLKKYITNKYTLGICLGMQVLSSKGYEEKESNGIDLIKGQVLKMERNEKIPHMGFSQLKFTKDNILFKGIKDYNFYFMHSYALVTEEDITTSTTNYGGHPFISSIQKDNVFGVQFHPEKSRQQGLKLFENFIAL